MESDPEKNLTSSVSLSLSLTHTHTHKYKHTHTRTLTLMQSSALIGKLLRPIQQKN